MPIEGDPKKLFVAHDRALVYSSLDPVGRFFYTVLVGWWRDRLRPADEELDTGA